MDIEFDAKKFEKEANNFRLLVRRHGDRRAKLIRRRLDELLAAEMLEDMRNLPRPRCHELKGDHAGQLSVDLDHPYRLIFEPTEPVPTKEDGGLDWTRITSIIVIGIEDTHD